MELLKFVIGICLIIGVIGAGMWFYETFKGEMQNFNIGDYNSGSKNVDVRNVSNDVIQFYEDMRFNHNRISYFINSECEFEKQTRMKNAFSMIAKETNDLISFYQGDEETADVLIGCTPDSYEKEENIFIAGEGGPTRIIRSGMPVILRGKILLYNETRSICDEPLLEIHELLHVFGYDHINNESYVMYPYLNCNQKLNSDLIKHLNEIYSIKPYADIYFDKVIANKEKFAAKWYLNFNISLKNQGILNAEGVSLKVSNNGVVLDEFDFEVIELGGGQNFYIKNLLVGLKEPNEVVFELSTKTYENNQANNILTLNTN